MYIPIYPSIHSSVYIHKYTYMYIYAYMFNMQMDTCMFNGYLFFMVLESGFHFDVY